MRRIALGGFIRVEVERERMVDGGWGWSGTVVKEVEVRGSECLKKWGFVMYRW